MADRAIPSRIPVPMKSPPTRRADQPHTSIITISHNSEHRNGSKSVASPPRTPKTGNDHKTLLMTGDMVYPEEANSSSTVKESHIPKLRHGSGMGSPNLNNLRKYQPNQTIELSPKISTKIPGLLKSPQQSNHGTSPTISRKETNASVVEEFPIVHAPVAELEDLSDLSQSSCSESEMGLGNGVGIDRAESSPSSLPAMSQTSPDRPSESQGILHAASSGGHIVNISDTSISFPEPLSSGDSGFVHDGITTSDPDLPERSASATAFEKCSSDNYRGSDRFVSDETLTERERTTSCGANSFSSRPAVGHGKKTIVASSSGEKFMLEDDRPLVRTSKSHENYLQAVTGVSVVNIDIDIDDNLAYSLDTLTYPANSDSSLEKVPQDSVQMSRSLHNSPERRSEKNVSANRDCMPGSAGLDECKEMKLKFNKQREDCMGSVNENSSNDSIDQNKTPTVSEHPEVLVTESEADTETAYDDNLLKTESEDTFTERSGDPLQLSVLSDDSDNDSIYHQPSKAVDRPSAVRLAKRLFHLEGFRKSDVSRHLYKK